MIPVRQPASDIRRKTEPALRLVIAYKLVRGVAALAASGLLGALTATGHTSPVNEVAKHLRHHVTSAWSIGVADAIIREV